MSMLDHIAKVAAQAAIEAGHGAYVGAAGSLEPFRVMAQAAIAEYRRGEELHRAADLLRGDGDLAKRHEALLLREERDGPLSLADWEASEIMKAAKEAVPF